jgi:putative alpha-1,2-mannosidase
MQLVTWLDPETGSDIAQSLYNQAQQNGGAWDRWIHNAAPTHVMNGDLAAAALADIWAFGGNVQGLFTAKGGNAKAAARLDAFFYDSKGTPVVTNAGSLHAELNNEPSIETTWLCDFAGQPWKTQQLVRYVLDHVWKNAPDGVPGNDDLGEMSSWAVFAALGMYPEIPGHAEFVLGSPLFPGLLCIASRAT